MIVPMLTLVSALAAPVAVPVQGIATNAAGAPLDGVRNVTFRLWPGEAGGPPVWSTTATVAFTGGAFSAQLAGGAPALDLAMFHDAGLWLSMQVLGEAESGRIQLSTTPYAASAAYAGHADSADTATRLGTLAAADVITWDDTIPWDLLDLTGATGDGLQVAGGAIALDRDAVYDTPGELHAVLDARYLQSATAASTYLSQSAASTTYLTLTAASSTYLTQAAAAAGYLPLSGGALTGALTLSGAPTAANHAATKGYLDAALAPYLTAANAASTYVPLAGGTLTGALTLAGAPTAANHAATKAYVDGALAPYLTTTAAAATYLSQTNASSTYLARAGGSMTGDLTLAGAPTAANHAATKAYVDGAVAPYLTTTAAAATYLSQTNASSTYLAKSGGTMTGTLVATTVDFGNGAHDDLVAADVTTLTGGGNADALHTHAGTLKPWVACGNMSDLVADCVVTGYNYDDWEYGFRYNTVEVHPAVCTHWNRGQRVYNRDPYWVQSDNPQSGSVGYGGAAFYTQTDATDDDACPPTSPRHQYWRLDATNNVIMVGGNGCFDHPIFCRRR